MQKQYASWRKVGVLVICLLAQSMLVWADPLSIDEAVNMALQNNLDIKISANSKQQADYTLQSTEGSRKISVDASNSFYLKQIHYHSTTNSSNISLSYPLYSGGKIEGNIENAKIDVTIADLELQKTIQDTRLKALSAYYDVIKAHKVQAVDQETVNNYVLHLNDVQAQYSAGNIARIDVLRSEVELADAQQTLLQAQVSYQVAVNSLKDVIKWRSMESPEFIDEFAYIPVARTVNDCLVFANQNRPDLEEYRLAIDKAKRSVDIARADKKPSVSLFAATGWGSNILPSQDNTMYVGVETSWNLFDGNVTEANVKKAQSATEAAQLKLTAQEDTVAVNVKEYYMEMKEAEERMKTTQFAIHKAEEDYSMAEKKYKVGEGILLDVIDAQLALTTAKNNYIEAQYDYAVYKAKLENAMGLN